MTQETEFVEYAMFSAIIHGQMPPIQQNYSEGYSAWKAGKAFHECPHEQASCAALSWRIGWNDCALANNT
jgi:ribosome modulation factor